MCYLRRLTLKVAYGNICSCEINCLNNVPGPDRALLFYIAIALNCLLASKLVCGTAGETMHKIEMNVTLGTSSVSEIWTHSIGKEASVSYKIPAKFRFQVPFHVISKVNKNTHHQSSLYSWSVVRSNARFGWLFFGVLMIIKLNCIRFLFTSLLVGKINNDKQW